MQGENTKENMRKMLNGFPPLFLLQRCTLFDKIIFLKQLSSLSELFSYEYPHKGKYLLMFIVKD